MNFMQTYKRLDKLCRDINGVGVTGYITDMERTHNGENKVAGWKDDYYKLKHYRYIRNQIAHEEYASEGNMCTVSDEQWIEQFHQRIINRTDPLALYRKAAQPLYQKAAQLRQTPPYHPVNTVNNVPNITAPIYYNPNYKKPKKARHRFNALFVTISALIGIAMITLATAIYCLLKY